MRRCVAECDHCEITEPDVEGASMANGSAGLNR